MVEILENRSCEIWQVLCGFKAAIEIGPIKKSEGRDQFMLEENVYLGIYHWKYKHLRYT